MACMKTSTVHTTATWRWKRLKDRVENLVAQRKGLFRIPKSHTNGRHDIIMIPVRLERNVQFCSNTLGVVMLPEELSYWTQVRMIATAHQEKMMNRSSRLGMVCQMTLPWWRSTKGASPAGITKWVRTQCHGPSLAAFEGEAPSASAFLS